MILLLHLVIVVCVSKHAAAFTSNECERFGNVHQKLEEAEKIIKSAKEELPTNFHKSLPMDCEEILKDGKNESGVYLVWPKNRIITGSISVYCDMDTDGGGWTVIQRRGNFSREKDYFRQAWNAYKEGFGNLKEEFWLGNDYIYALSNQKLYSVRFDLGDLEGNKRYAVYDTFWIEEEGNNYALHVNGYNGSPSHPAGDSFSHHSGSQFSTIDRKNDKHGTSCAQEYGGGWWYNKCYYVNLNGKYIPGKVNKETEWKGIHWYLWKGKLESLATTEIKIRANPSWVK